MAAQSHPPLASWDWVYRWPSRGITMLTMTLHVSATSANQYSVRAHSDVVRSHINGCI